jgi:hypothetical protein
MSTALIQVPVEAPYSSKIMICGSSTAPTTVKSLRTPNKKRTEAFVLMYSICEFSSINKLQRFTIANSAKAHLALRHQVDLLQPLHLTAFGAG